jgi:RNA polymerase sigma factor (sigma-70 family)
VLKSAVNPFRPRHAGLVDQTALIRILRGSIVVDAENEYYLAAFSSRTEPGDTSRSLLELARRGDRESLNRLCRIYGRLVWKRYLAKVPKKHRNDLCQDVFQTVSLKISTFQKKAEHDGAAFRTWLSKIATNKVLKYWAGEQHATLTLTDSELDGLSSPEPDEGGEAGQNERGLVVAGAFEEVLRSFEPKSREVIIRVLREGEPIGVVAEALGMTENAVHILKSRALRCLRGILKGLGEPVETTLDALPCRAEPNHGEGSS